MDEYQRTPEGDLVMALLSTASLRLKRTESRDPEGFKSEPVDIADAYDKLRNYGGPLFAATVTLEAVKMYERSKNKDKKNLGLFSNIVKALCKEQGLVSQYLHQHPEVWPVQKKGQD